MPTSTLPFAVIFDMDGVIIDSNPVIIKAWNTFFARHDIILTDDQLNRFVFGRTTKDTLRMVFEKPLDEAMITQYGEEVSTLVAELYEKESRLVPGITEFVTSLSEHKIPIAIATSAPRKNVDLVLRLAALADHFQIISDATHVHLPKPDPEVYRTTAHRLGISATHCLVFEDSFSGISAAKAAGMLVIGVSTTHSISELISQTVEVIADFTSIDADYVIELMRRSDH